MYNYNVTTVSDTTSNIAMWSIIAFIIAVAAGILVYFLFLRSKEPVSNGFQKVKDFLNFKTLLIEPLLKILYLVLTIFIILYSFTFIALGMFGTFLIVLIVGPIVLRLCYESFIIVIMIWKNTKEISDNTKPKVVKKEKKDADEEK